MSARTHNDDWEITNFVPGQIILAYNDGFHRIVEVSDTQISYIQVAKTNGKLFNGKKIDNCHKAWCNIVDEDYLAKELLAFNLRQETIRGLMR